MPSEGDRVELDLNLNLGPVEGVVRCCHCDHVCVDIIADGSGVPTFIEGKGCDRMFRVPYHSPLTDTEYGYAMRVVADQERNCNDGSDH